MVIVLEKKIGTNHCDLSKFYAVLTDDPLGDDPLGDDPLGDEH